MSVQCRLLSAAEYDAAEARRRAGRLSYREAFGPGAMWHCPWYHDPTNPADDAENMAGILSVHYRQDWARKRAPLMVITPNGHLWCVDQTSSNGTGWTVRGDPPALIVTPSIVVPGYHGWLGTCGARPGWFTADLEGRGPNGSVVP